jgi:protocatechuate 3,4-dioxygenase beta subunit
MGSKQKPVDSTQTAHGLKRRQALQGLGALAAATPGLGVLGCGNESGGGATGGAQSTGGASTGGASTGGVSTGGASTGGVSTGGASTGGAPSTTGGAGPAQATGGAATTGGEATGGAAAGGPGTGGTASGGAAGGGAGGVNGGGANGGQIGAGGSGGGALVSPPWTNVPVTDFTKPDMPKAAPCNVVTKTDGAGQGPFFIHELEKADDVSLVRQDIRGRYNESAAAGVEMQLHVRLIDKTKSDAACAMMVPASDIEVYIWHTDAQGFYSGFGTRGTSDEQKPDAPYAGKPSSNNLENADRFCRGVQTTNSDGVVSFLSVFPGWYNGRVLHIHIVCFKKGSMSRGRIDYNKQKEPNWVFTTQFYFDVAFTKSVHEKYDPYKARIGIAGYTDMITPSRGSNGTAETNFSGREATATMSGDTVIAQIQMIVDPS